MARRYRPYGRRSTGRVPAPVVVGGAVAVLALASTGAHAATGAHRPVPAVTAAARIGSGGPATSHAAHVAAVAIAWALAQRGAPYIWGGPTAPGTAGGFDCSGLVQQAYAAAGLAIPRTSQAQFAWGPQIPASQVRPGDLVFFAGSDGIASAPGHVAMVLAVTGDGTGQMAEAYATGYPVRVSGYGTASAAPGDETPVGFTRPAAHGGA